MSNKTRKRFLPVALVMAVAAIGVVALAIALAGTPRELQAHGSSAGDCSTATGRIIHDALSPSDPCPDPNQAPTAGAAIAAQTVMAGSTVMVQSTITDADTDDTLTWNASSSDNAVATVVVSNMGMVTVSGVTAGTATITVTATDGTASATQTFMVTVTAMMPTVKDGSPCDDFDTATMASTRCITSSSTSASATVELTVVIESLDADDVAKIGADGGSVEVFLEDDFQVPDDIAPGSVYFRLLGDGPTAGDDRDLTGGEGRVRATYDVEVNDGDFFGGDDDWAIQVFLPDFYTASVDDAAGFQGPMVGQTLVMVFTKSAGIKNPSEQKDRTVTNKMGQNIIVEGAYKTGYKFLGSEDDADKDGEMALQTLPVKAKVSLDDEDNKRGYELTVTGSGFNNGVTSGAYVLNNKAARFYAAKLWETLDCEGMKKLFESEDAKYCFHFNLNDADMSYTIGDGMAEFEALDEDAQKALADKVIARLLPHAVAENGTEAGGASVGSDDKATITFEVTAPTFKPGNVNRIAVADGEGRVSSDADLFNLEPSIRVSPTEVSSGDTVTVFAQDFEYDQGNSGFSELKLAGQVRDDVEAAGVGISKSDGSATATFVMPGGLKGTIRVDAKWGTVSKNTKITVASSTLSSSQTDVLPNDSITLTGNGFSSSACVPASSITLDNVAVVVDDESLSQCTDDKGTSDRSDDETFSEAVAVSNGGQFVATVHLTPAGSDSDLTLIPGSHSLDVEDSSGFTGSVTLDIAEPAVKVTPDVAGPRDYITITGENWPVDNPENPLSEAVKVMVKDAGNRAPRQYSAFADTAGRFTVEHQVHRNVTIPSNIQVEVTYGTVVKLASFDVPVATITVDPGEAQPGDMISITATDMPVYTDADQVKIGGSVIGSLDAHTDRDGNITVEDVLVPGLDPGTYSVQLTVKNTVAIGELKVLAESAAGGAPAELPGAVENLGDNLVAIFHFDDVGKVWSFYDPRPEFAELNTLTELVNGEAYWILVSESVEDVVLNNKVRSLTCRGDDCWNLEVW